VTLDICWLNLHKNTIEVLKTRTQRTPDLTLLCQKTMSSNCFEKLLYARSHWIVPIRTNLANTIDLLLEVLAYLVLLLGLSLTLTVT
jgi:hypothetical protein